LTTGSYGTGATKKASFTVDTKGRLTVAAEADFRPLGYGSAPGTAAGTGAGTGPTISITGNDSGGKISVTTGSAPATSADVVTITFANAFSSAPGVCITPANAATAAIASASAPHVLSTTSNFKIKSNGSALGATTAYEWYYTVIG
jgi:hypothetical protein